MPIVPYEKETSTRPNDAVVPTVGTRVLAATRWMKTRAYPMVTRVPIVDIALIVLAMAFGAISLAYPFGRDQGLFYYVGREWIHGSVPYRDSMDQKPPLIYLIYALATILFGENLWSIRLLEFFWVLLIGHIIGSLVASKDRPPIGGTRGVATLTTAVLYWGYLSYWDTAQCEIWAGGLCFVSLWAGHKIARRPFAWWLAGGCAGLALLAKPTVVMTLAIVAWFLVFQLWHENPKGPTRWRAIGRFVVCFSLGEILPIALMIGYFWAVGALSDCVDILIGANRYYVSHEPAPGRWWQHLILLWLQSWPFSLWIVIVFLIQAVLARKTRSFEVRSRNALAALLLFYAIVSVVFQNKFYGYHWGILVFPGAYVIACSVDDFVRWLSLRWKRYGISNNVSKVLNIVHACIILSLYFDFAWTSPYYSRGVATTFKYLTGSVDEEVFNRQFDLYGIPTYWWGETLRVGRWIAKHSKPDDMIAVRGFEPAIYAISGRRAPTRFFWTSWLTDSTRAYKRIQWLSEDRAALRRGRPRYFVVFNGIQTGTASARYAMSLGYDNEMFSTAHFRVLARRK